MPGSAAPETGHPPVAVYRLPATRSQRGQPSAAGQEDQAWSEPLLRQNAIWFCQLRWIVVAVFSCIGIAGFVSRPLTALGLVITPYWPLATAAILAGLNVVHGRLAAGAGSARVRFLLWTQITTDLLVLTAVIHWLGSDLPSAPFMYLFHIILACLVFPPGESLVVAGLAAGFYFCCLVLEAAGVVPRTSVLSADALADEPLLHFSSHFFSVGPMFLIWIVIWHLVSRLAGALRRRERELALTNRQLEASIDERAKHMLQTTHQLKAPFADIHAQAQLLLGGYCGTLPAQAQSVVEKISSRCMALSRQIQEMLQLANLRSQGQHSPARSKVDVGALVEEAINRIEPAARQRGIRIQRDIRTVTVNAVEDHLTMLLDNLVVNAVIYSFDDGVVQVACQARSTGEANVVVQDHGIGIPEEKLPRIFDDYYRTDEAVQHNRTSTGLGLAIVRHVAQQAQVDIQVESAPGWGTRFTVTIPAHPDPTEDSIPTRKTQAYGLSVNR